MSKTDRGYRIIGGNGGGALNVAIDSQDKAFGWLCDAGEGVASGSYYSRTEKYEWWIQNGEKGDSADYREAKKAFEAAAARKVSP